MAGPRLLIDEKDFRLVRTEDERGHIGHVLEVHNGYDALGVERWRDFSINGEAMKAIFGYLIRVANKQDQEKQQ